MLITHKERKKNDPDERSFFFLCSDEIHLKVVNINWVSISFSVWKTIEKKIYLQRVERLIKELTRVNTCPKLGLRFANS